MKRLLLCLSVILSVLAGNCIANDSIGALGAGGIELKKTDDISMEKEVLTISADLVRVEYEFVNKSAKQITEKIFFPMPFYGFDHGCSPAYSGQLHNFKVWVNDKEIPASRTVRARLRNGLDVTARLKKLGFADEDIAEYRGVVDECGEVQVSGKYAQNINLLSKEELVGNQSFPDQKPVPLWEASYVYYWDQNFPPDQIIHVVHEYTPFVGTGSGRANIPDKETIKSIANRFDGNFCIDEPTLKAAKRIQKRMNYDYAFSVIEYVLITGANWSGPIKDFTLNLKKRSNNDIVSLCFDGKFVKRDGLTITSHINNLVPKKDIQVLFLFPYSEIQNELKNGSRANHY